jgi:hypothetical protein
MEMKDVDDRAISGNVIVTGNENAGVNARRAKTGVIIVRGNGFFALEIKEIHA